MSTPLPKEVPLKTGEIVRIRAAVASDAAAVIAYVQTVATESDMLTFGAGEFQKTVAEEAKIFREHQEAANRIFLIALIGEEIAGILNVNASAKPRLAHIGEFGITVRKAYWGKGIGRHLLQTMLDWARTDSPLRKINLIVLAHNDRGIALYKRLGFRIEGRRSRGLCIDGVFYEDVLMGLDIDP